MKPTPRKSWRFLLSGRVRVVAVCLLWAIVMVVAYEKEMLLLVRQEFATVDLRFRLRGTKPPAPEVVILAIDDRSFTSDTFRDDEETLQRCPELRLLARYPFKRRVYAAAIQRLSEAGAKVIALDLLFLQPSTEEEDHALGSAIERYRDRVVIVCNFSSETRRLVEPEPVVPTNLPKSSVSGYDNFAADVDHFVRRAQPVAYESDVANVYHWSGQEPRLSFAAMAVRKFEPDIRIPDAEQLFYIDFDGPSGTFPSYEFYKIFYDKTWKQELKNGDVFRNKIVLIGPVGNFQQDQHPTSFGPMDGVEIHASAIGTLLHGTAPRDASRWWGPMTIFVLALLTAALLNTPAHPLMKLLLLLLACLLYFGFASVVFARAGVILLVAAPLATVAGGGVLGITMQVMAERLERIRARQTLEKYVSKPVADEILRHSAIYENSLGGERRAITILFADIRGFTTLSERADPGEVVTQLNEYFTAMTEIIMEHHGTLSKFIGDEIMAIFGAPLTAGPVEDAWRAVQTAYEMRVRLAELQLGWAERNRPPFHIGMGVNFGEVLVGNIGSPQRMEYTVIGDAVNVASRMEKLNKEFGTDILMAESVYELVKDRIDAQRMKTTTVRGREKELNVYFLLKVPRSI